MDAIRDTIQDFEALPTIETELPLSAGHRLIRRLGSPDGYEIHVGDKPCLGTSRRAIIKTAPRRSPGYLLKRRRLVEEARIGAAFRHPNLVSLHDAIEDERGTHLVYEHVEGTDLERASARLRAREEAFPFELCVWMTAEVLRGASYVHALRDTDGTPLRLVLRDLVPANVLIARTGHIKLATFSFNLVPHGDDARPHPRAPAYLAPERVARRRYDGLADVYSAGVLLFELLFGRACWADRRARSVLSKVLHDGMPLDQLRREGVPDELIALVAKATALRPEDRYSSASQMARDLLRWLDGAQDRTTASTVARFFERQGLFEEGERKVVPVSLAMHEDATEAEVLRRTIDQEMEPTGNTLSALIIRSDPEPAANTDPEEAKAGRSEPQDVEPRDVDPGSSELWSALPEDALEARDHRPEVLVDAGRQRDLVLPPSLPPPSLPPPEDPPIIELQPSRARVLGTVLSVVAFALSVGIALLSLSG